jgi:hypothetical protein
MMLALDALQRRYQAFDQFGVHSGFDNGESVAAAPVGMDLNLRVRQHVTLPGMTLYRVLARSIARGCGVGEVFQRATNAKRLRKGRRNRYRVFQNATTRWAVAGIRRA